MFKSIIAWLKKVFSLEPVLIGGIKKKCGNCDSCKCPDSAHVNVDVAVAAEDVIVAPPKKSAKKPRTPKV